jgi:hypothetical protein
MNLTKAIFVIGLSLAGFTALGHIPAGAGPTDVPKPVLDNCFFINDVRDYQTIKDDALIIEARRGQFFKLELSGGCFGIDSALEIGLKGRSGFNRVCGAFDAEVVYRDIGSRHGLARCAITDITAITQDEAKALTSKPKSN